MEIKKYLNYRDYKVALDHELERTAEGFVRIGYLLRMAEDTNILEESGYKDVNEFAKMEYNLDPSQVSRFININKKFAEGGYSDRLQDQYRGFGYAKLSVMLLLPESVNEVITPNYTKNEILAIKGEVEAEQKVTDLELLSEGENDGQQEMDLLHKVFHQLGHDDPELYRKLHMVAQRRREVKDFIDILAPSGEGVKMVRIQGVGRLMVAFKGVDSDVSLVNARSSEKENFKWQQIIDAITDLLYLGLSSKESWSRLYKEAWPVEEEIAPVQEKITKVTKAKIEEKKKPEKKAENKDKKKTEKPKERTHVPDPMVTEEPRQQSIEDFPQYLPEGYIMSHDGSEVKENPETKLWNEIEDQLEKLQAEMKSEEKDIEYMLQAAELMVMTLKEIKAVRTEDERD